MPRLAKRILTAFVAVLLLGLAGCLYFSWTAREPLRFRIVGEGAPVESLVRDSLGVMAPFIPLEVEVVNTQPFAIHLDNAYFDIYPSELLPLHLRPTSILKSSIKNHK